MAATAAAAPYCSGCAAPSDYAWTTPSPALRASTAGTLLLRWQQQRRRQFSSCHPRVRSSGDLRCRRRLLTARDDYGEEDDEEEGSSGGGASFDAAVALFNGGEYHACHDVVEELWYTADEPCRTLLHAILQCDVAFHHLFKQNHRGAMMELGEGLCKLRKLHLEDHNTSPFARFREEVAAVLSFLYRTQKELGACTDDLCLAMDASASSYQLLGNFAAGQQLYRLEQAATEDHGGVPSIVFFAASRGDCDSQNAGNCHRVRLPRLRATEQHLAELQCTSN